MKLSISAFLLANSLTLPEAAFALAPTFGKGKIRQSHFLSRVVSPSTTQIAADVVKAPETPTTSPVPTESDITAPKGVDELVVQNERWRERILEEDPEFFNRLSSSTKPTYMWIGSSDLSIPPNMITEEDPQSFFVVRNVGNLVNTNDNNLMSALTFAVNELDVPDIIVCGQYGCGGVRAAMRNTDHLYPLENWVQNIRDVYRIHQKQLDEISDPEKRQRKLVELNVKEQCINLFKTGIVQKRRIESFKAGEKNPTPRIHACVFDPSTGKLKKLNVNFQQSIGGLHNIYALYSVDQEAEEELKDVPAKPTNVQSAPAFQPKPPAPVSSTANIEKTMAKEDTNGINMATKANPKPPADTIPPKSLTFEKPKESTMSDDTSKSVVADSKVEESVEVTKSSDAEMVSNEDNKSGLPWFAIKSILKADNLIKKIDTLLEKPQKESSPNVTASNAEKPESKDLGMQDSGIEALMQSNDSQSPQMSPTQVADKLDMLSKSSEEAVNVSAKADNDVSDAASVVEDVEKKVNDNKPTLSQIRAKRSVPPSSSKNRFENVQYGAKTMSRLSLLVSNDAESATPEAPKPEPKSPKQGSIIGDSFGKQTSRTGKMPML